MNVLIPILFGLAYISILIVVWKTTNNSKLNFKSNFIRMVLWSLSGFGLFGLMFGLLLLPQGLIRETIANFLAIMGLIFIIVGQAYGQIYIVKSNWKFLKTGKGL